MPEPESPTPISPPVPLRLAVREVWSGTPRPVLSGRVESGQVRIGETLVFFPSHRTATVEELRGEDAARLEMAVAGQAISFTLRELVAIERGQIATHETETPIESNRCRSRLRWAGPGALALGERVRLQLASQELEGEVTSLEQLPPGSAVLPPGATAEVTVRLAGVLVMDNYDRNPAFGVITVRTPLGTGAGHLFGGHYTDRVHVKSRNISWSEGNVTERHRALRNGHRGAVLWLTGLSGSGKSTLSRAVERELFRLGMHVYVLDGDNVRHGLNANLGFSPEDREENIRRVAEMAKLMCHAGFIVVTAFISPYRMDRRRAREIALEAGGEFIEIFVHAPLEVCEQRDVKGLYKKARAGTISEFTGISAPYEAPLEPELTVRTDQLPLEECTAVVIDYLNRRLRREATDFEI